MDDIGRLLMEVVERSGRAVANRQVAVLNPTSGKGFRQICRLKPTPRHPQAVISVKNLLGFGVPEKVGCQVRPSSPTGGMGGIILRFGNPAARGHRAYTNPSAAKLWGRNA